MTGRSGPAAARTTAEPEMTGAMVPNGLAASAASSSQINLSWNPTTDNGGSGLAGYIVYRSGLQIGTTAGTSFSNTGLSASSGYCYTVAAYDNAGNISGQSGQACATTPAAPDTVPPNANLTAPANGATVSGMITLSADASDNVGVTRVEFYCDAGTFLGSDTSAPYSIACDTMAIPNGARTFSCKAYDAAGNFTTSAANSVTVNNGTSGTPGQSKWAKRIGGIMTTDGAEVTSLAKDPNGNMIVAGVFTGTVDVGGTSVVNPSTLSKAIFVAKYNSSGGLVWVKNLANGYASKATKLVIDQYGDVVFCGWFQGSINLGGGTVASTGMEDSFVAKYAGNDGHWLWSKTFGSYGSDWAQGVTVDSANNVVATGFFYDTVNFGGISLTSG